MPYNYKALAAIWLAMLGLFAIAASGAVSGAGAVLLSALALGAPMLLTRSKVEAVPDLP